MALEYHIKFNGIEGESTDARHKGEVQVMSWAWGLSSAAPTTPGGPVGKAHPTDLHFTHKIDKASPILARRAAAGQAIPDAVLSARKAGAAGGGPGAAADFFQIAMKEVFVTSVQLSGSADEDVEQVSVRFRNITMSYRPQDAKGGLGAPVEFNWDTQSGSVT